MSPLNLPAYHYPFRTIRIGEHCFENALAPIMIGGLMTSNVTSGVPVVMVVP